MYLCKYDYYGNVYTDDQQLQQLEEAMSYVEAKYNSWQQLCEFINANSDPNAIKIRTYSKLGIAYNNTQVTNASDFLNCQMAKECSIAYQQCKAHQEVLCLMKIPMEPCLDSLHSIYIGRESSRKPLSSHESSNAPS